MAVLAAAAASLTAMAWVSRGKGRLRAMMRALRVVLGASLLTTEAILLLQGRWQEAIPLHLCSLSALAALALTCRASQGLIDFLWYLGIWGAALALAFPAPAVSRWQALLNASYYVTHALIVVIPLTCMAAGRRPRRGRGGRMFALMQGIALVAWWVNRRLGTDFLFLMAPPLGTPLEIAFAWGYPAYLLALEALLGALLLLSGRALPALCPFVMK